MRETLREASFLTTRDEKSVSAKADRWQPLVISWFIFGIGYEL